MLRFFRPASIVFCLLLGQFGLVSALGASPVTVVAAENFYGNVVSQLGGDRVTVLSILSDPNVDPHEYESNIQDAKAISGADLVVENAGGYDDWMDKLLSASPNSHRILLKGYELAPNHLPDNEHVWYSPENMMTISQAVVDSLKKLDPMGRATYEKNLAVFRDQLKSLIAKEAALKAKFSGAPIALTETIFLYQAQPLGLKVLTPFDFQKAVAEGTEPAATDMITAQNQVKEKRVKVLVYNAQTSTPVTDKLQVLAKASGIPVVAVTETMPTNETYQAWMGRQLAALEAALGK